MEFDRCLKTSCVVSSKRRKKQKSILLSWLLSQMNLQQLALWNKRSFVTTTANTTKFICDDNSQLYQIHLWRQQSTQPNPFVTTVSLTTFICDDNSHHTGQEGSRLKLGTENDRRVKQEPIVILLKKFTLAPAWLLQRRLTACCIYSRVCAKRS